MEDKITIKKYEVFQPNEETSSVLFSYECLSCKQLNIFSGKYEDNRYSVICPKCLNKYTVFLVRPNLCPPRGW